MTTILKRTAIVGLFLLGASGCQPAESNVSIRASKVALGAHDDAQLVAFQMGRRSYAGDEVGRNAQAIAEVLTGRALPGVSQDVASAWSGRAWNLPFYMAFSNPTGVRFGHRDEVGEFLVLDQAITSDVTTETDIGPDAARKLFEAAVAQLSSRGVVDGVGYDVGAAHMSRMMMGAGRMDESPLPQVKEYIFEVPRTINGIEVLGSGIRISVHKKGALASILVVDPVVSSIRDSSGVESPTGEGHAFQRAVAAATLDARVVSEFPNRQVRSSKVAYVLPDGPSVSVLAPQQVYILAPTFVIDGKIVTGRLERVSCLLDSPSPVATLWPKPNPGDPGDGMK